MTITEIRDLLPGQILWDDQIKGLHVRVTPAGKKNFMLYYRMGKAQRRPKIGEFGVMTLHEARIAAKKLLNQVDRGFDPSAERKRLRGELTMNELFNKVMKEVWSAERYQQSNHAYVQKHHWEKNLKPTFGSLGVSTVDQFQVREWHQSMKGKPFAANRSKSLLSKLFAYSIELGLRPLGSNPCSVVKDFPERKRTRYATEDEVKAIMKELNKYESDFPAAVAFIRSTYYTGSRIVALERAKRDDLQIIKIDGERYGVLNFKGKTTADTGEEETIIFPPQILLDILALPRFPNGTIFGTKYPRWLWRKVREDTGIEGLWARDSRRTFATFGFSSGVEKSLMGAVLNHRDTNTTDIYAKLKIKPRIKAVSQVADVLDEVVD